MVGRSVGTGPDGSTGLVIVDVGCCPVICAPRAARRAVRPDTSFCTPGTPAKPPIPPTEPGGAVGRRVGGGGGPDGRGCGDCGSGGGGADCGAGSGRTRATRPVGSGSWAGDCGSVRRTIGVDPVRSGSPLTSGFGAHSSSAFVVRLPRPAFDGRRVAEPDAASSEERAGIAWSPELLPDPMAFSGCTNRGNSSDASAGPLLSPGDEEPASSSG